MRARRGQVAVCLAVVLVAVIVLALMNVNIFLTVRAKNRAMNAGDAAAIAVAKWQGELLNRIGKANLEHLKAALENDVEECEKIVEAQKRNCFLEPLRGISKGNEAAKNNGLDREPKGEMRKILKEHAADVRNNYTASPQLYPAPWEGAWDEYVDVLETELGQELVVGPDSVEYADARNYFPLALQDFYNAIAGEMWCWFHFNGEWMLDSDSESLPMPDFSSKTASRWNSEVYSLHLTFKPLPQVLDEDWTNIVMRLAECNEDDIRRSYVLTNQNQLWAFYDSRWRQWSEWSDDGGVWFNPEEFPIVGTVKPEYDVFGCSCVCRVQTEAPDIMGTSTVKDTEFEELGETAISEREGEEKIVNWTAAAKPFGTVENLKEEVDVVTSLKKFVTGGFTEARLVPVDAACAEFDTSTSDYDWIMHVRHHIPSSLDYQGRSAGCWYCQQLNIFDRDSFRQRGKTWLRAHAKECVRPRSGGTGHGGARHAH